MAHEHIAKKKELDKKLNKGFENAIKRPLCELGSEWKPCTIEDINAILQGDRDRYDRIRSTGSDKMTCDDSPRQFNAAPTHTAHMEPPHVKESMGA